MLDLKVQSVEKIARCRWIQFEGSESIEIFYLGNQPGFQAVFVNDVVRGAVGTLNYAEKVPFTLHVAGKALPAYVQVEMSYLFSDIKRFRVVVESQTIYQEGEFAEAPLPAEPTQDPDSRFLEKQGVVFQALVILAILASIFFSLITSTESQHDWLEPYLWSLRYLVAPIFLFGAYLHFKFPNAVEKFTGGGPYYLYSNREKAVARGLVVAFFCILAIPVSGTLVTIVNAFNQSGTAHLLKTTIPEYSDCLRSIEISFEDRKVRVPIPECHAKEARPGEQYEIALLRGHLGILYTPSGGDGLSRLSAFYLQSFENPKWVRMHHVKAAADGLDRDTLKSMAASWNRKCDDGQVPYCRLYGYFMFLEYPPDGVNLLRYACLENDSISCFDLIDNRDVGFDDTEIAAVKLFNMCKADVFVCRSYWDSFSPYIELKERSDVRNHLCGLEHAWACRPERSR